MSRAHSDRRFSVLAATVLRAVGVLALAAAAPACTSPLILEDTAAACRNAYDDDGDGLTDCLDPDCAGSGACETSQAACTNGIDDDHDTRTDCEQETCRAAGFCDAVESSCAALPQSGCLAGMSCYVALSGAASTFTTRCRIAGTGTQGDACDNDAIEALGARDAHPCGPALGCSTYGTPRGACAPFCFANTDCPAGGMCIGNPMPPTRPGICTVPCNPISLLGCHGGSTACRSFHEFANASFNNGGARFACLDAMGRAGAARVGDLCDDPPTAGSSLSRVCGFGSVCAPDMAGGTVTHCRASCNVRSPACSGGARCIELYTDGRRSEFADVLLGYCL